jgi:hypothetical protein
MKISHRTFSLFLAGLVIGTGTVLAGYSIGAPANKSSESGGTSAYLTFRERIKLDSSDWPTLSVYRDEREDTTCYVLTVFSSGNKPAAGISCVRESN